MKKTLFLTSVLAISATIGAANATIEGTESAQIKANLETEFKVAPEKSDYSVKAPDGTDSTLAAESAAGYTSYAATTSADGTLVALNDDVVLNIAQGAVSNSNYKYASKDADGIVSMVAGDTIVSDLSKNYTSEYITTPISVSTAMDSAPTIDLGTDASDAVYITGDGNYYLLRVGDDILLNGDANVTADNPNTYNDLLTAYNADVEAIDNLYTTLVGYKAENTTNAAAVVVARDQDNGAIQNIVANQLTFTTESARYTSDAAENASYVNSLAQAIDKSIVGGANDAIAASVTDGAIKTALNGKADVSAVEAVATDLATNYSTTEQITNEITGLIATKESNISEQLGYDVTKNPANADEPNSLTSKLKSHDTNIVAAINTNYDAIAEINSSDVMQSGIDATKVTQIATNTAAIATEKSEREAEDLAIRSEFAAADELTLNTAKAYADAGNELAINQSKAYTDERIEKLDKDLSAGVASAVALSSVSVSGVKKGEVSVGGGYGYFNGQSAAALGAAMGLSDRWSINAGAGLSSSDVSFRAGTNYKFKLF